MYERCKKDFFFRVLSLFFCFFSTLPSLSLSPLFVPFSFFCSLPIIRYYYFLLVSWNEGASWTRREKIADHPSSPRCFLTTSAVDITCYIYFTLRADFRSVYSPPPCRSLLSFIRSFSSSPSTNAGSVDRSFRTPSYANESHSFLRSFFFFRLEISFFYPFFSSSLGLTFDVALEDSTCKTERTRGWLTIVSRASRVIYPLRRWGNNV